MRDAVKGAQDLSTLRRSRSAAISSLLASSARRAKPPLRPRFSPLAPDIAFLIYCGVPLGPLMLATTRAALLGVEARHCLIASGALSAQAFAEKAAAHFGLATVTAARPDRRTNLEDALRQGWFRADFEDGRTALVIAADGPAFRLARARLDASRRGHLLLATGEDFRAMLLAHFGGAIAEAAATSVPETFSARRRMEPVQAAVLAGLLCALLLSLVFWPGGTVTIAPLLLGVIFLTAAVIHLAVCWEGWRKEAPVAEIADAALPSYSVLVPLHREGPEVIRPLVAALDAFDYPREKLQILLVAEAGDSLTQEAIRATPLPPHISLFTAPDGQPRTKPRALNTAMPFVTGAFVVVYDAEDRPDPQQLRKAAALFRSVDGSVACLQARLAIDNSGDGLLPGFFRVEYAALFDVTKSGSARLAHPIPLGGTSNHFRTPVLRAIGLWDAWNVTEDADLGFRLARHGYRVADLDSTTDEEAPAKLSAWMAQRTRWLKGWMQTVLTHSRAPLTFWRELGPGNAIAATALSLGVIIGTLFGPLFHALVLWRIATGRFLNGAGLLDHIADGSIIVLGAFGLASTFVPALIAMRRRDLSGLGRLIPFLPLYHLLMAVAGWRALYELATAPHRWNKTEHGLARTSRRGATTGAAQKQ
jgi:cellulose synthase/poly-beta-1,6-N-acetylglucosamine synthase-like glycosyltransferase